MVPLARQPHWPAPGLLASHSSGAYSPIQDQSICHENTKTRNDLICFRDFVLSWHTASVPNWQRHASSARAVAEVVSRFLILVSAVRRRARLRFHRATNELVRGAMYAISRSLATPQARPRGGPIARRRTHTRLDLLHRA